MFKYRLFLLILGWAFSSSAHANSWACRVDFESQCSSDGCAAEGFSGDGDTKPVFAHFDATGMFSLCMYTGCYEGLGKVNTESTFLTISKFNTRWSGTGDHPTDVFIFLDRADGLGMFKAATFVQPIICKLTAVE